MERNKVIKRAYRKVGEIAGKGRQVKHPELTIDQGSQARKETFQVGTRMHEEI